MFTFENKFPFQHAKKFERDCVHGSTQGSGNIGFHGEYKVLRGPRNKLISPSNSCTVSVLMDTVTVYGQQLSYLQNQSRNSGVSIATAHPARPP